MNITEVRNETIRIAKAFKNNLITTTEYVQLLVALMDKGFPDVVSFTLLEFELKQAS